MSHVPGSPEIRRARIHVRRPQFQFFIAVSFLIVALSAPALLPLLSAQVVPTTTLNGTVTDPSGAVIPEATVEAINSATGVKRQTRSNAQGLYLFNFMAPGRYRVDVTAPGFHAYEQAGITLDVNVPATVNVRLGLSSTSAQVTVAANAEMIDTESGTLHQVVGQQYLGNLPLDGRNAATLVTMAPGVTSSPGQYNDSYANSGNEVAYSVNGTYGDQIGYNLDGAPHKDLISDRNATFPNPDALEEFSVQTNNFDARFGGVGGAVVNIVTKSGTNTIHGDLFEYVRNGDLNAINYFATTQDKLKRNQFGGVIGGPILRTRLFYFGSFQATTINNISEGNLAIVPTAAERQGILPGMTIPESSWNPLSRNMLADIPTTADPKGQFPNRQGRGEFLNLSCHCSCSPSWSSLGQASLELMGLSCS